MTQLFGFTAADPAAQRHLAVSIENPIKGSAFWDTLSPTDSAHLRTIEQQNGGLYAWGAVPGKMNNKYFDTMNVGDFVLCVYAKQCHFVAQVVHKSLDPRAARYLWGEQSPGITWEKIFYLSKPFSIEASLKDYADYLPAQFLGFARVGNSNCARIIKDFGSIANFVDHLKMQEGPAFAIRSNLNSVWDDSLGKHYRFGKTVPNQKKLKDGGLVVVDRKVRSQVHIIGFGRLSPAREIVAASDGVVNFESDFLEWHALSPGLPWPNEFLVRLKAQSGYNAQHAVRPIEMSLFQEMKSAILGTAPIMDTPDSEGKAETVNSVSIDDVLPELFMERPQFEKLIRLFKAKKNLILQGSPGVGKTFVAKRLAQVLVGSDNRTNVEAVQFHQAYSYEDFIQGFRPHHQGQGFEIRDGIFHRFCQRALSRPNENFVFIIDEINRGNLGKIFGELLMLIEADKRSSEWSLRLAYADQRAPRFFVPPNVHILGMMNTADRSLTSIDYALRRRFAFQHIRPAFNHPQFKRHLVREGWSENFARHIVRGFNELNVLISEDEDLREGFCVGHSYFCGALQDGVSNSETFSTILETEIRPLLEDYWYDKKPQEIDDIISTLSSYDSI